MLSAAAVSNTLLKSDLHELVGDLFEALFDVLGLEASDNQHVHRKVLAALENMPPSAPSDGEVDVMGGRQAGSWQIP